MTWKPGQKHENTGKSLWRFWGEKRDVQGLCLVYLTWLEACRILERKGTMAHSTHRNQKMKRTPEDWTPRSLSYWIRNVAKSWDRGGKWENITRRRVGTGGGSCKRRDWVRFAKTELLRACEVKTQSDWVGLSCWNKTLGKTGCCASFQASL